MIVLLTTADAELTAASTAPAAVVADAFEYLVVGPAPAAGGTCSHLYAPDLHHAPRPPQRAAVEPRP